MCDRAHVDGCACAKAMRSVVCLLHRGTLRRNPDGVGVELCVHVRGGMAAHGLVHMATLPPPLQPPPPPGGDRSLGPKSVENTRCRRRGGNFYKAPMAPKLIYTVILWYSVVVRPPPPLAGGGEPSHHDRPPPPPPSPGGGTVMTKGGGFQGGGRVRILSGSGVSK